MSEYIGVPDIPSYSNVLYIGEVAPQKYFTLCEKNGILSPYVSMCPFLVNSGAYNRPIKSEYTDKSKEYILDAIESQLDSEYGKYSSKPTGYTINKNN